MGEGQAGTSGAKTEWKVIPAEARRGEGEDTEAFVVKLQLQPVAGLTLGLMCRYLSWVFTDTLMVARVIRSNRPML